MKKIILGITGSIAAYKSPDLVRMLTNQGYEVKVAITASALNFVTKNVLELFSRNKVYSDVFEDSDHIAHIELAKWSDLVLIAPATANIIAKIAMGLADDMLTNLCLATTAKIILAPAMNQGMWSNEIVHENVSKLKRHNLEILGPKEGTQICGDYGIGNMVDLENIVAYISTI